MSHNCDFQKATPIMLDEIKKHSGLLPTNSVPIWTRQRDGGKNMTADWSARERVRAKSGLTVKRILRKYKYPPNFQEAAVELALRQAEALGELWS